MRKLIIILGMRSGTSVTTRISQCMGAYLGEDNELMGAALSNPDGHFENIEIVSINKRILHFCDREWYSLEKAVPDYNSPKIKKEMERIKAVLNRLFEKSDTVAIKDPRICVLFPLWNSVLNEMGLEVNYIWVFRNPLEVVDSLKKRNGYSSQYSLLLWIHYNLNVLKYLQGREYLLINYRDILEGDQALEKLSRLFHCKLDDTLKWELKHIIKQKYCHSDYSVQDVRNMQNKLAADLYSALLENRKIGIDVAEWERLYETATDKTEDQFLDYEIFEDNKFFIKKEIIIYGAGNFGKRAAEMLQQLDILKYNFCDKDIHKHGMRLMNGKIFSITEIENKKNLLIIVAIENKETRKEMERTLAYIEGVRFLSFFALEKVHKYRMADFTGLLYETEKISSWYRELSRRADKVRNACKSSVLVYQNGKVASASILKGLQKVGIESAHIHRFFFKKDIVGELILGEGQEEFIYTSSHLNDRFSEYVKAVKKEIKGKKIITMVREPIAVDLATIFQWIELGTTDRFFSDRIRQGEAFGQIISELMIKIQNRQFRWFDEELKELSGIDVYSRPFDKKEGYTILSENGVDILLLKVENLSNLSKVIREFIGEQQFELLNENVGRDKEYAHLYETVKKELKLSSQYVENYYHNNSYMNHFYSKEEQRKFLERWKRNIRGSD